MTDDGPDHHPIDRRGEMYALEDATYDRPALPGEVVRTRSVDELIDAIAANLVIHAENCVREFGDFHLALSGGSTPQPLYERLMYDPDYRRLPWRRTHLWIVDERRVPLEHEARFARRSPITPTSPQNRCTPSSRWRTMRTNSTSCP